MTPFGIDKENICTNKTKAENALQMYRRYKYMYKALNGSCFEPCSYIGIRLLKATEVSASKVKGSLWPILEISTSKL